MKTNYPFMINEIVPQVMNLIPLQQPGGKFSLVAIQGNIQLPIYPGVSGTHKIKMLRIEHTEFLSDPSMIPRSQQEAKYLNPPMLQARSYHQEHQPRSEGKEFECIIEGKSVLLRKLGKVVKDEDGNFYEVQGQQIHRLGELVMDDSGKIFEVCPSNYIKSEEVGSEKSKADLTGSVYDNGNDDNAQNQELTTPKQLNQKSSYNEKLKPHQKQAQTGKEVGYKKLLEPPGVRLKLPYVQIKSEIISQLENPDKLDDRDFIECYAQIYEAHQTMPIANIAAKELGNSALHTQLQPLTQDKAKLLGLSELFKQTPYPYETRASVRQIYPNQRVYHLSLVFDPTIAQEKIQFNDSKEKDSTLCCQIPQQYLNPLQFKYSREEVLYDMKSLFGTLPPESNVIMRWFFIYPLRLLNTLITMIASRSRMKKWRTMLQEKSCDEQLWEVTPPRNFSCHPAVRCWAKELFMRLGYNSDRILFEWEVFWRRRGH